MWVEINIIWSYRVENKAIFVACFQAIRQSTHFPPFLWHLTEFYPHPSTISCFPWSLHLVWRERSNIKIFQFWKKTSQQQTWAFFCDLNSWGKHLIWRTSFHSKGHKTPITRTLAVWYPQKHRNVHAFSIVAHLMWRVTRSQWALTRYKPYRNIKKKKSRKPEPAQMVKLRKCESTMNISINKLLHKYVPNYPFGNSKPRYTPEKTYLQRLLQRDMAQSVWKQILIDGNEQEAIH